MLEFAWPWVFACLPLPWLLRRLLPAAQSQQAALKVTFLRDLIPLAKQRPRVALSSWRKALPYSAIWLLLVAAAARPQWLGEPLPLPTSGRDLLLAVDISGSMDYPDMTWQNYQTTRLEVVKHLFGDFIEQRYGDRVGLILFGSQAYLQAPLTFDRKTVRTWLDEAVIGIAGNNTAIGDAIGLALKRLREQAASQRVLILITDGANNGGEIEPTIAAKLAAREQVKIYTIGIGINAQQAQNLDLLDYNAAIALDEPMLQEIASQTGGQYFHATSSEELHRIGQALDQLEPAAQPPEQTHITEPLYHWPLAVALLASFSLLLTREWLHLRKPKER